MCILFLTSTCIEESDYITNTEIALSTSALMLQKLEGDGDYINSPWNPALINAEELYNNLNKYHIIDIRPSSIFALGRIKNAINIPPGKLVAYLGNINTHNYSKIIIVSSTGQLATFCTSLLRLLNYKNVYSLNFGIAVWHNTFANCWLTIKPNSAKYFSTRNYPVVDSSFLLPSQPVIEAENLDAFIENKVRNLLKLDFNDVDSKNVNTHLTIDYKTVATKYYEVSIDTKGNSQIILSENVYIICYGNTELYLSEGHPKFSNLFRMYDGKYNGKYSNFRSSQYLANIPSDKLILIYSFNGQRSASVVAYLNLLGFTAKSIVFGACGMGGTSQFKFTEQEIKNYEYIISD